MSPDFNIITASAVNKIITTRRCLQNQGLITLTAMFQFVIIVSAVVNIFQVITVASPQTILDSSSHKGMTLYVTVTVLVQYNISCAPSFIVTLLLPFERYKFACDQQVVSFRCISIGEIQQLTTVLTTSEMMETSQSTIIFNHGHGEQV